jgi:Reverse transcriptase (RNA-dependent DNA polymerase)
VIEPRNGFIAGAEIVIMIERNMSRTVMRGLVHPAGVEEHITRERIVSELGRSHDWPGQQRLGPHREGEEPKPMMHGRGKSDSAIVALKPANKAERSAAELGERRAGTKGNADQQSTGRAQNRATVTQALERIRQTARQRKKERFTALFHHISVDLLRKAFFALKQDAAPGTDGKIWQDYAADYGEDLELRLKDLHARVQRGAYRPLPSRRVYIPKPDGRQRPLAVAALEDKIVQRATAEVLNAIYEEDFLGFSYGFRPQRSAHDAMDALIVGIGRRKVNWIMDADIRSFLDRVSYCTQVYEAWLKRCPKRIKNRSLRAPSLCICRRLRRVSRSSPKRSSLSATLAARPVRSTGSPARCKTLSLLRPKS